MKVLDVVSQFHNPVIEDGFSEDEIRDFEHGEERHEISLDGIPVCEFEGIGFSPEEIEALTVEANPFDIPAEGQGDY